MERAREGAPPCVWAQPLTLAELVSLKAAHPAARIIVGNTEVTPLLVS